MPYEIGKLSLEALLKPISAAEDALARLDERVARSEVGQGFAERADFFEAVSNMWVAGELVHLEDLVLHDAKMDVRAPSHELVIAHRIVRARRRAMRNNPGWAISRAGIIAFAGIAEQEDELPRKRQRRGEGRDLETDEHDALPPELAEFDEVLAETSWLVEAVPPDLPEPGNQTSLWASWSSGILIGTNLNGSLNGSSWSERLKRFRRPWPRRFFGTHGISSNRFSGSTGLGRSLFRISSDHAKRSGHTFWPFQWVCERCRVSGDVLGTGQPG